MRKKIILNITEMDKVYLLEKYGRITYVDEFIDVVFLEIEEKLIPSIIKLPFVSGIEESGKGSLLLV
ncbi:hypothetical protein [Paenibacillus chungangensis]